MNLLTTDDVEWGKKEFLKDAVLAEGEGFVTDDTLMRNIPVFIVQPFNRDFLVSILKRYAGEVVKFNANTQAFYHPGSDVWWVAFGMKSEGDNGYKIVIDLNNAQNTTLMTYAAKYELATIVVEDLMFDIPVVREDVLNFLAMFLQGKTGLW